MKKGNDCFKNFIRNYWNYYRQLENEFLATRRYVDFNEGNFKTYSIEFLKLYQAVCSEIDVIGKAIAGECNPKFRPEDTKNNIYKWWFEIQNKIEYGNDYDNVSGNRCMLKLAKVCLLDEISITPWDGFEVVTYLDKNKALRYKAQSGHGAPDWWNAYNKVKHSRTYYEGDNSTERNYAKANLGNVIKAFAALYILEKSYMEVVGTQNNLEAFADYSVLFDKVENETSLDIDELFKD